MAQTPADAPPQTPAETPAQTPAQTPPDTPAQAPAPAPAKKPVPAAAQEPPQARRSRLDLSLGYTYANYDQQDEPRLNMNGFNLGADVNLLKWLQVGANLTEDYNRQS